jgi:hypothetical protein
MPKMGKNIIKLVKNNNSKKVKNSEHRNSWQPMRQASMYTRGPDPFSFEESGERLFFCHSYVPNGFSTCFIISQGVAQHVPNCTSIIPNSLPNVVLLELIYMGKYWDFYVWSKYSNIENLQNFQDFIVMGQLKRL